MNWPRAKLDAERRATAVATSDHRRYVAAVSPPRSAWAHRHIDAAYAIACLCPDRRRSHSLTERCPHIRRARTP